MARLSWWQSTQTAAMAVVLLLGKGSTPYPQRDPHRFVDRFGVPDGLDLVQYDEQVLDELYAVTLDSSGDLQEVTAAAVQVVRREIVKTCGSTFPPDHAAVS